MRSRKDYNQYLFFEFGFDVEAYKESAISETWPFILNFLESDDFLETKTVHIYEFSDGADEYFLLDGESLAFYKKAGLSVDELKWHVLGAAWIRNRDPLSLNTSQIGFQRMPSVSERKERIQALWERHFPGESMRILEGLYLRQSKEYLALIESITSDVTAIVGNEFVPADIQWEQQSPWRRLTMGIGKLVSDGKLKK